MVGRALLLLVAASSALVASKELTQIDNLRNRVMAQIDKVSSDSLHREWQYLAKKTHGIDGQLMIEFGAMCDYIDTFTPPPVPTRALESIWTYALKAAESKNVEGFYSKFRNFQENPDALVMAESWSQFAESCLKDPPNRSSVYKSLGIIQEMIYDGIEGHKSMFQKIYEATTDFTCEIHQSPQQLVFNMYSIFQLTQLKAYTMVQFSWMLLRAYGKGNFTKESAQLRQKYLERIEQQAIAAKNAMKESSNEMHTCDPTEHIKGETHDEVTKFLQGFIVNEVDLNSGGVCTENCAAYKYTKQTGCFKDQFCAEQPRCTGNVVGCKFVDSDMWICQAPHLTGRRYDWIQYENGRVLGQKKACSRAVNKVDSWWRWLFWHCSYCFCYCDDPRDRFSDRYFSLRPVVSNVTANKVVTGVRFTKLDRVFYIQIQEGVLISEGQINASTVAWKPVDQIKIGDPYYVPGTDYHMLTWEERALDLDDLMLKNENVLTGLKLRKIGGHLNLEIQGSHFNFTSGKLTHEGRHSEWMANDITDASLTSPRSQIHLIEPNIPSNDLGQFNVYSKPNSFIEFRASDDHIDAAQTAVPFVDTQELSPQPPVPLVGAGVLHKGRRFTGGFISLKLFTYDFNQHIQDFFPQLNEADM